MAQLAARHYQIFAQAKYSSAAINTNIISAPIFKASYFIFRCSTETCNFLYQSFRSHCSFFCDFRKAINLLHTRICNQIFECLWIKSAEAGRLINYI